MKNKMTTPEKNRSVAAGISIPRNRFDNLGWHSFVGIVALLVLGIGNIQAQPTASWPIYRSDASLSGRAKVDGPVIPDLFWVKNIGAEKIESPVVNVEGTIIFASRGDKYVYALNTDGSEKWRFSHKLPNGSNEIFSHPPTLGSDGTIYAGTEEGGFFAINPNGSLKWRVSVGGYVGIAPNFDNNGNLYLACDDAQLYVFNPAGNLLCIGSLDGLKPSNTPVIVSNARIYVPAGNSIFVFNSSCERIARWIFPSLEEVAWVVGNSTGNTLYVGSLTKSAVIAIEAQTGKQVWSYSYDARFGRPSQPALGPDGTIYFAGFDAGLLVALNPDGKEKWTHDQGSARYKTMPVVDASGDIYIVNETLGLAAFAPNKTLLWNLPNVQCKYSPAFGLDGTLYVPSLKKLYAVRPQPPYAVSLEYVKGDSQEACIDSMLAVPIIVRVRDQYRKEFNGQPVRFGNITIPTSDDGTAKFKWRLGSELGRQQLEVSSQYNNQHLKGSPLFINANAHGPKIDGDILVVFDTTAVKEVSEKKYTIKNLSGCVLTVNRLEITDDVHPSFFVITGISDTIVAPQSSIEVRLQFAPLDSGTHNATLRIYSNDSSNNPFNVALRGEASTKPQIFVDPSNRDFGRVKVGDDSMQTITIHNLGTAWLVVSALNFSDSVYATGLGTPVNISPNNSATVPIKFSPKEAQAYPATLKIISNDTAQNPAVVTLNGVGTVAPEIQVSPNPLPLSACKDSVVSGEFTISNRGNVELIIASLKSDNPAFVVDTSGFKLAPSQSRNVKVTFSPKAVKADSTNITIVSNDPVTPTYLEKVKGNVTGPEILLTAKHSLLELCRGQSAMVEVCIKNPSDCVLRVDSLKYIFVFRQGLAKWPSLPREENVVIASPLYINPGDSVCLPPHEFKDTLVDFDILVRARSNGAPDPDTLRIPVNIKPPIIAAIDTLDFGRVPVGEKKLDSAKVWSAQCQVQILDARITGANDFAFSLDPQLAYPITLNEGDTVNIPVVFHPKDNGVHTAFLEIISNDPSTERDTLRIVLLGNGVEPPPPAPNIVVTPDTAKFGVVCDTTYQNVVVSNSGGAMLMVSDLIFNNSSFFTKHAKQFDVAVGDSEIVSVGYVPTKGQSALGQLLVRSNATKEDSVAVLKGDGGAPQISGKPSPLPFPVVNLRDCATGLQDSSEAIYEIGNPGSCDLVVTSFKIDGSFSIESIALPLIIAKNTAVRVKLYFKPHAKGDQAGALHLFSNALNTQEHIVVLQGTATATPLIAVKPDTLRFAPIPVNTSANAPVTVMNIDSDTLRIEKIEVTGTVFTPDMTLFSLTCKDTRNVNITFAPNVIGHFEETLTFTSNGGTKTIVLIGYAVAGPQPCITVAPSALEFGTVCSVTKLYVVISNSCPGTLDVSSLEFSDSVFSTTHVLPFNVKPFATDTVWVQYQPVAGIESRATMKIASNDTTHPIVFVPLHGIGGAADIDAPAELVFPDTKVDSVKTNSLTIANVGDCIMHAKMTIIGPNADEFTLDSSTSDTADIPISTTVQVKIDFKPKAPGSREATLVIKSNDPNTPAWEVKLIGNGIGEAVLEADPSLLDFGDVTVNEKKSLKLYLKSRGRATLIIHGCITEPSEIFGCEYCKRTDDDRIPMEPGAVDSTTVEFTPKAEQEYTGTLTFQTNGNVVTVNLRGRGVRGNLALEPALRIPTICAGTLGLIEGKLVNHGPGNIYIYGPLQIASEQDSRVFEIVSPNFSAKDTLLLGPNQALPFVVKFEGTEIRTYNESLVIVTNLHPASRPFRIPLAGTVAEKGPKVDITSPVSFSGYLDQETSMQEVVITNSGCETLMLGDLRLNKGKHFFIRKPLSKDSLATGESVVAMVTFKGDNFTTFNDELSVPTNDPAKRVAVATLTGKVKDGKICFKAEPEKIDFGKIKVRQSSEPKEVKLINCTRDTRLKVSVSRPNLKNDFKLSKTEFLIFPNPDSSVNFENMYVTFVPQVSGVQEEVLQLTIMVPDSTEKAIAYVTIRGEGIVDSGKVEVVSNVITPNGDDYNDEAIVEYSESLYPQAAFHVFDLRGLPVRVLRRPARLNQFAWDGKDENGGLVLPSVYIWILEDQGKRIASGRFVIIR